MALKAFSELGGGIFGLFDAKLGPQHSLPLATSTCSVSAHRQPFDVLFPRNCVLSFRHIAEAFSQRRNGALQAPANYASCHPPKDPKRHSAQPLLSYWPRNEPVPSSLQVPRTITHLRTIASRRSILFIQTQAVHFSLECPSSTSVPLFHTTTTFSPPSASHPATSFPPPSPALDQNVLVSMTCEFHISTDGGSIALVLSFACHVRQSPDW
jgi:hypothetical protein